MKKNVSWLPLVVIVTLTGCVSLSTQKVQEGPAYWVDTQGKVVRDASGHCVRTILWVPALATAECDADIVPKKVAQSEPAPVKAEPAPAPKPQSKPQPVPEKISLKAGALFDVNKADLKPAGKSELDALASRIKDGNTQIEQITVTGHTDSAGASGYNRKLSERRAEAVKAYLVSKGLNGDRIETKGAGDTQPVASNKTAAGRAQNRRVEIDIRAQRTTSAN